MTFDNYGVKGAIDDFKAKAVPKVTACRCCTVGGWGSTLVGKHSRTTYAVSRNIPVTVIESIGIFQYHICSQ
jgi:hypothetical protein